MAVLGYDGLIMKYGEFSAAVGGNAAAKAILDSLKLSAPQRKGPNKIMKIYKVVNVGKELYVHLPRHLLFELPLRGVRLRYAAEEARWSDDAREEGDIILYPNQQLVIDHLMREVYEPAKVLEGRGSATIELGAGQGKTFLAGGLLAACDYPRTLYIVPRDPLAEQAAEDLKRMYPGATIARLSPTSDAEKCDIMIAVINSAAKMPLSFFAQFGLIVLDEVHMYCTPAFSEVFWKVQGPRVLAMSATVRHRTDGFDPLYYKCCGVPINCAALEGFDGYEEVFNSEVRVINYNGSEEYTRTLIHPNTGMPFTPWIIPAMASDPERRRLAVRVARELYDWRGSGGEMHNIYVFAEQKEILDDFRSDFVESLGGGAAARGNILVEDEIAAFYGGITKEEWKSAITSSRMLCSTYQYSGTGTSIPKMTAIIFLTPRKTGVVQIAARILRRGGNNLGTKRIIYDIVDNKTILRHQFNHRLEAYKVYNMKVVQARA